MGYLHGMSTQSANPPPAGPVQIAALRTACSNCNLRELCLPLGLPADELQRLDEVVSERRKVPQGQALFNVGQPFRALFAVRTGFFKTVVRTSDGREQVTGFQMAGELLGLDGIGTGLHQVDAVALEDADLCIIPFEQLETLSRDFASLQRQIHKVMSREIVREQSVMILLGSMRADERIAAFLLNLTKRLNARGFSEVAVLLRMSREEIGSYLGMTIETVSRTLSKMQAQGILAVDKRELRILAPDRLASLVKTS